MHYVAVFHDVFLSFCGKLAGSPYGTFTAEGDEVLIFDDFSADETSLEIRMDNSCGFRGLVSLVDGPGAAFVGACSEECLETEKVICPLDEPYDT